MSKTSLSVSDFARFSRTTRAALLHYDRIGLLGPLSRGKNNNYRYYSTRQLAHVNLIRTLKELGLTLEEIKDLKDKRTPELAAKTLIQLMGKIDEKMMSWLRSKQLLFMLLNSILSVSDVDEKVLSIQDLPTEAIVLGAPNDYSNGQNPWDALLTFYLSLQGEDWDMNYPVWGVFSGERIKRGDWNWPDRYYFYNPEGRDRRPAGCYAIGYTRGAYGQTAELYKRLIDYIDRQGFEICGECYEEYPLNELSVSDDTNYLIRIMIGVREKK